MVNKMRYEMARESYQVFGVDTEEAIRQLSEVSISMHCWQGDDVTGFETTSDLNGGIAATGHYPGKARTPKELMADIDQALKLIPGRHRINLHAKYAITGGETVDRNQIMPVHFKEWVKFAKERGLGIDFNPTFFSHPLALNGTLSSSEDHIREFWIEHGKRCIKIAEHFAEQLGGYSALNIWIPDGSKDIPADRLGPRQRLLKSLDEILSISYDRSKVLVSLESKVFGIGLESYTVGSHEFYMNYAAKNDVSCLLDSGHFHPTESIADKISSMLLYSDKVALHITRPVRWDSDHVVLLDDETKEIAKEVVFCGLDKTLLALDYFDASINRVAAWVVGMRNIQKALLYALLYPKEKMISLQNNGENTELLVLTEELKTLPFGDVWSEFCMRMGVSPDFKWFDAIRTYETKILNERGR